MNIEMKLMDHEVKNMKRLLQASDKDMVLLDEEDVMLHIRHYLHDCITHAHENIPPMPG